MSDANDQTVDGSSQLSYYRGAEYYNEGTYYCLDSWDGDFDGANSSIVFNPKTQEVLEVSVCDYKSNRAYRLSNFENKDTDTVAWDETDYTDLETDEDMLDKLTKIMSYQPYDERVQIPVDLPDHVLLTLAKEAHARDITLDQLMVEIV